MDHNSERKSPLLLAVIIIVIAFFLIVAIFFLSSRDRGDPITLPDGAPGQSDEPGNVPTLQNNFVQVSVDNVRSVVETLARPSSYHQIYQVTLTEGERQTVQMVDIWVNGQLLRADVSSEYGTASILTDRNITCLWYSDDENPARIQLNDTVTSDDLLGLPTYELLLNADPATLTDAMHIVLQDPLIQCIYAAAQPSDDTLQEYWIDIHSGLLHMANITVDGQLVYTATQESLELLGAEDEAFSDHFLLPDGSQLPSGE